MKIFKKKNKSKSLIIVIIILALSVVFISSSYALFSVSKEGNEYNFVKVGNLDLEFENLSSSQNILQLVSDYPISDLEGKSGEPFKFSITNVGTLSISYRVKIIDNIDAINEHDCNENLLDSKYIKYTLNDSDVTKLNVKEGIQYDKKQNEIGKYYEIYSGKILPNDSALYELRLWIDNTSNEVLGKHFHGKIFVEIEQENVDE